MILFPLTHTSCLFVAMLLADVAVLLTMSQSGSVERSITWLRILRKDKPTVMKYNNNQIIIIEANIDIPVLLFLKKVKYTDVSF